MATKGKSVFVSIIFNVFMAAMAISVCIEDAGISSSMEGLMGGWTEQEFDASSVEMKEKIIQFANFSLNIWNEATNDLRNYRLMSTSDSSADITKVYTQVVAGTNYCIQFSAEPFECKNGNNQMNYCTDGSYQCEAKIYEPLPVLVQGAPAEPQILPENVNCERVLRKRKLHLI